MATIGTATAYDMEVELWGNYAERLEQFFVGNRIVAEKQKAGIFLACVRQETYEIFQSLLIPVKLSTKTFEELLGTLNECFSPSPSEIMEWYEFKSSSQKDVQHTNASLRNLTDFCNFGDMLDIMIRNRLVCVM
ncbi:hypothetical protein HPB47_015882 [Ixodes persulcatus]|uniref:Uncharacterized protein n=1 Tax=Ixodes persulcatus TaxID=34615 RepID=A0AC60QUB5_IXOPE|nr:hypothetical protein HPB47_015882 [Ixodes persulcatus]